MLNRNSKIKRRKIGGISHAQQSKNKSLRSMDRIKWKEAQKRIDLQLNLYQLYCVRNFEGAFRLSSVFV